MTGALAFDDGSRSVRVRVPAKINLHLGVGDRRSDGYHDLTTVYQGVSLYDEVIVTESTAAGVRVEVAGDDAAAVPLGEDNLAVRAALALGAELGVRPAVTIRIAKRIPIAGGLAGGSADAAATLVACSRLWGMPFGDRLAKVAAGLGSDIPFCLTGGTALGTGHGERVEEVTANGRYHWVVAAADGQLSTPAVYAEVDRLRETGTGSYSDSAAELLAALRTGRAEELAPRLRNDMTEAAISLRPQLREVLEAGAEDGALATLVSGSGPTTLFLARDVHHATALAGRLRMRRLAREVHSVYGPAFVSVGLRPAQPG